MSSPGRPKSESSLGEEGAQRLEGRSSVPPGRPKGESSPGEEGAQRLEGSASRTEKPSSHRPILFDDFVPGRVMGEADQTYGADLAASWQRIFGSDPEHGAGGAAEAASLVLVMMMRAYLSVVAPRPPGNIHSRQRLRLNNLPQPGETVRNVVLCRDKAVRRDRRHVELAITGRGFGGRPIYEATLSLIWAA